MISKKIIFLSCVLLIFLSIGNISAIDVNNTIQSSNVNLNEVITSNEINEQDVLSISDENEIYGRGSSKDLQKLVDNAQGTLDLNDNYEFTGSSEAVKISKNITINGNGHTINGKRSTHMFSIAADGISVVLKNIEFKDGKSDHGGAIFNNHENTNLTIINCTFNSNAVYKEKIIIQPGNGAAIYSHGKLTIINSKFHDNYHSLIINELKDSHFVPKEINIGSDNGAIYCTGNLLVNNSYFSNNLAMSDGGAIYCTGNLLVNNSYFSNNLAVLDGGAIYCGGVCSIYNSKFENNHANNEHTSANYGGAIYSNRINTVNNCIFSKNKAYSNPLVIKSDKGGAIYISDKCNPEFVSCRFEKNFCEDGGAIYLNSKESNLKLTDCSFIGNTAKYGGAVYSNGKIELSFCSFSHNSADVDGGAIYNSGVTIISNSKFVGNAATGATVKRSFGGAIRSEGLIDIKKSTFENNNAYNLGGAVYGDGETRIKNSTFMHNSAKEGGAVFAEIITEVANSQFIKNNATSGHGGALYINYGDTTLSSCIFEENTAPGKDSKGGGIYKDSSFLTIWNCEFYRNSAGQGGGVYTSKVTSITHSYFIGNKATAQKGDGGGVYVNNECDFNTYSCRYEDNEANNRGGAIYTDSTRSGSKIGIDYCTFVHNKAKQTDYTPNGKRLPGHSVFHSGYYKYVKLCWFGKNDPDTTNQIVEYHTKGSDDNIVPNDTLRVDMKAENMNPLVGNPYTVTIYFSGNGLNLNKWNLYHSDAKFGSTYVEFSNIKTKVNDITATYVAKRAGTGVNIHGYLDDQYLVLNLKGVNKDPSEVKILTCEDVKYPNALNVTYKINPMSESKYVIKDAQNKTVKTGSLTNPNSVYIEGLTPGSYSITISNTETWNNLAGSDTKTFTVNRGDIEQLRVVVYNKTYPEDVDCTVYASVDGEYNLTVGLYQSRIVVVKNNVAYINLGVLDAGTYEAIISFAGDENYNPTSSKTTFDVNASGTFFEIEINASKIIYGETATVTHNLSDGATGTIKYYLSNGTFIDELPVGKYLILPILDAGSYVVIANYSGDNNFLPAFDSAFITVNPAPNSVNVSATNVTYGENTTIEVSADVDGIYQLDVNGIIYDVTVNNGFGSKTISLNAGSYYANASFADSNYNTVSKNANFNVYKAVNNLDIVIFDTVYPNDVSGFVYAEVDGEYKLTVGEYLTTVVVKNGKGEFNAGILDAGEYLVVVNYPGDLNYEANSYSTNVTVSKFVPNISLQVNDFDYGDVGVITITSDIPGSVNVTVNGITEILDLNGQSMDLLLASMNNVLKGEYQATLRLNNLDAGLYPVTVVYNGDGNIESVELSGEFNVNALNVTMDINATDINVGDDEVITVILSSDVNGTVTVVVDDMNYSTSVSDGKAVITISGLSAGYKNANVYYSGDTNHNSVLGNVSFAVNKLNPVMSVESNTPVSGENIHIVVYLLSDATGTVTLALEGKYYTAQVKDGKAVFDIPGLAAGKYNITAYYSGDDKYNSLTKDVNLTVKEDEIVVSAPDLTKYYSGNERFTVNVAYANGRAIAGKEVKITINGVTYKRTTDENGTAGLNINLNSGVYPVRVVVDGVEANFTVTVQSTIDSSDIVKIFRNGTQYNAIFTDANGTPLPNIKVSFNLYGIIYNRTTDKNGAAKLNINLDAGDYIITAFNSATGEMKSNTIKVISLIESSNLTKYYRNASQFVVRIHSADGAYVGAGEEVTFNINGVIYTRTTNATGHAKLNINLHQGNYTITTHYKDCGRGNTIEVLPILTADDLSMKYMDGSQFKAQLVDGKGNFYPKQTVTFNINGVFYNRLTDNGGIAKLNIRLMAGQYIITSSYNGCNISNKITIWG